MKIYNDDRSKRNQDSRYRNYDDYEEDGIYDTRRFNIKQSNQQAYDDDGYDDYEEYEEYNDYGDDYSDYEDYDDDTRYDLFYDKRSRSGGYAYGLRSNRFYLIGIIVVLVLIFCVLGFGIYAIAQSDPNTVETYSAATSGSGAATRDASANTTTVAVEQTIAVVTTTEAVVFDYTLCFSSDISVADDARTTAYWISQDRDITKCIDSVLVDHMRSADICFINNEFQYFTRGTAQSGKPYTFRGDPENVSVLQDLGVDIVSLANNHTYDYGEEALLDTLDTLQNAGIPYVGAGENLEEASAIYYYELDGFTVAFLSNTRIEWVEQTKGATEDPPGVFRTAESNDLLYEQTKEAVANADYVVVYMYWGVESVTYQEEYQTETGRELIEYGADAVIGDHTHCLQGIEFYKGKPILYSMENYWFNGKTMDTMLAELHISGTTDDFDVELQLIPAVQTNCQIIYYDTTDEQNTFYRNMESLSSAYGISIDEDGIVTES